MTARIIPFHAEKARRIAQAKGERIRELAEELAAVARDCLDEVCAEYEAQGWATPSELKLARREVER
jgi:hypothetical protein